MDEREMKTELARFEASFWLNHAKNLREQGQAVLKSSDDAFRKANVLIAEWRNLVYGYDLVDKEED
jgi:hypothetical protein